MDSVASGKIPCQEGGTAWGTYRRVYIELCEPCALTCESIEIRCLDERMTIPSKVAPAEIVCEDEDKVRTFARRLSLTEQWMRRGSGSGTEKGPAIHA